MKFTKKALFGIAAAATFTASAALADYPEKPIKIMVGFSAGGGTDTTAQGFASYMHEASMNGQPAYIVNLSRIWSKSGKTGPRRKVRWLHSLQLT